MTPLLEFRKQQPEQKNLSTSVDQLLVLLSVWELLIFQLWCREVRVLAHLPQLEVLGRSVG